MTIWRPAKQISIKALGLVWRNGLLLAAEVHRDDGSVKGVRPLGGTVEFGETWQAALVRELDEELGVEAVVSGTPLVLENIYEHHGETGHEIIFAADITVPDGALPNDGPIHFAEDNGVPCIAKWFDINTLDCGDIALYPQGLKALLRPRARDL